MRDFIPLLIAALVVALFWRPLVRRGRSLLASVRRLLVPALAVLMLSGLVAGGVALARTFITTTWTTKSLASYSPDGGAALGNYFTPPASAFGVNCEYTPVSTGDTLTGSFYIGCSQDGISFPPVQLGYLNAAGADAGFINCASCTAAQTVNFELPANLGCLFIAPGLNILTADGGGGVACQMSATNPGSDNGL